MIIAWAAALLVGLSLGLLGSGGAILTVPILVYLLGHAEKSAIAESLAIVGAIAVAGVVRAGFQRRVDFRTAALLALPGILGTLAGSYLAGFLAGAIQLLLLAGLMLVAAGAMFLQNRPPVLPDRLQAALPRRRLALQAIVVLQGLALGLATGLVGVGGGFLIIPVLVVLRRLPMSTAIGTSLAIIALNSATGLLLHVPQLAAHDQALNGPVVILFSALGILGSLAGNYLAGRINHPTLSRLFGVFLIVMSAYIIYRQAPAALGWPRPESQPVASIRPE